MVYSDMGQSKQERYEVEREKIQSGEGIASEDGKLILDYLDAADPNHLMTQLPSGKTKAPGTLHQHANSLSRVAKDLHHEGDSLAESSTDDLNRLMSRYLKGDVPSCKDSGLSNGTVNNRQGPLRVFYRFHQDLDVEPDDLTMMKLGDTSVDENDMFTKDEVHRIREAAKTSGIRDICLVDLLLYTGQRISAILHLRLKDVDENDGTFKLNTEAGDLKGASGKRPLLRAEKSVRDWKSQHPTGEPDDFLITCKVSSASRKDVTAGGRLSSAGIHRILSRIGDMADVDKPVNAHNFRHYFVTACIRNYDMDKDTVKHLIGHEPDSTVMESTYSHLTDDDYIEKAEVKQDLREPDDESPLTPPVCDVCDEPLEGDWHACPNCGTTYSPKAHQTKQDIDESVYAEQREAEPESQKSETVDDLRKLLKENPELMEELVD